MVLFGVLCVAVLSVLVNGAEKIQIAVDNVNFAVVDSGVNEPPSGFETIKAGTTLSHPSKIDSRKKLIVKFSVKNKQQGAPVSVHQAFVAFIHVETKREVVFMAIVDKSSKGYMLGLDMKTHYKDFDGLSGKYALSIITGDASAANAIYQHFADVSITVPSVDAPVVPKSKIINYSPLPVIQHLFAEPLARPPQIVSDVFTVLCAFPFLILLGMWVSIGFNFKNLSFSIWALGFHVGLAAIFVLYFFYWTQLNMFQTLKYLGIIGIFTFVCGNRFLHNFHKSKKTKVE